MAVRRNHALEQEIAERDEALTGGWRVDLSTEAFWWSPELYEMLGVEPGEFAPTFENVATLVDPHTAARLENRRRCMRRDAEPFAEGYWITRPDGVRKLLDVRGWRAGDERPAGVMFGTCRDVTDAALVRSERERWHRRQASILSAAGDGICGLDLEGRITFTNPALRRLMRRPDEDLIDARLHDLVHRDGEGRELHLAAECPFHVSGRRPASAIDPGFHRADGSRIEVGFMLVGLDDGDARGVVVSFRDITARRAAARLLQTSLRHVQTLSAQRGALLGHLAEAEERERLRIASDIHDDTIQALGAVALRLSSAGERVSGDAERDVLVDAEIDVRRVAERLRGLMFELMPPDGTEDLRSAVETYCSVLFAHSEMRYELVGDVRGLRGDSYVAAYRLIQEAVRNARTHSRGTRVQVAFEDTAGELVFRVSDDGVGMGDRTTPPTHAGLRIVRQRAEAAGGSAEFGPGLDGRGSSIVLRMPLPYGGRS